MKGFTTIVTTALLLGIAISIAGLYASWAPEISKTLSTDATEQNQQSLKCDNAALSIQNPEYYTGSKIVVFELRNTGTIRFTDTVRVAVFNGTRLVNSTNVEELEVGETDRLEVFSSKRPTRMLATTTDCPNSGDNENMIEIN